VLSRLNSVRTSKSCVVSTLIRRSHLPPPRKHALIHPSPVVTYFRRGIVISDTFFWVSDAQELQALRHADDSDTGIVPAPAHAAQPDICRRKLCTWLVTRTQLNRELTS